MESLSNVMDPEMHMSIVDMGLIYNVKVSKKGVHILMTLTTIGCPLYSVIEEDIRNKLADLGFLHKNIKLELTFDPPWSLDRMSKKGKAMLGI